MLEQFEMYSNQSQHHTYILHTKQHFLSQLSLESWMYAGTLSSSINGLMG